MKLAWQEYLSVGVAEIDDQHKLLFDKFNALLAACEKGEGAGEVNRLFAFLGNYVITHFSDEERLMKRTGFPDFQMHLELHHAFIRQVADLKERLDREGPTPGLVASVALTVNGWLIEHISGADRAIGRFMKEQRDTAP